MASEHSAKSEKYHRILIMKKKFKKTVDNRDLEGTRLSLSNEMMLDPRGESFCEMRQYAEASFPQLYDIHDGELFNKNQDKWDETLLFYTKNALDDNFSKERLDFYYALAKVVLKDKAERLKAEQKVKSEKEEDFKINSSNKTHTSANPLYAGVAIGGIIIGGAGLIMGKTIIATVGLVGAAIGGGLLYNEKSKKK